LGTKKGVIRHFCHKARTQKKTTRLAVAAGEVLNHTLRKQWKKAVAVGPHGLHEGGKRNKKDQVGRNKVKSPHQVSKAHPKEKTYIDQSEKDPQTTRRTRRM